MDSSRRQRVLISGASIAGPALAFWLHRYGFTPTVIERAEELRDGGQNVDVRGAGREVARRMGIEDDIRTATTGEKGVRFVTGGNVTRAKFAAGTSDTGGPTAELEILRGDLARLLYDRTATDTEYVFGDRITGLEETADGIIVSFEHGENRAFDIVVAADGIRSFTRSLVFGDEVEIVPLGLTTAYLTIPRSRTDTSWARWYNAPGGRTITLRPDNVGTTRATLSFLSEPLGVERLGLDEQKRVLRQRFHTAGWESRRVLAALDDATDLYIESIGQVKAPHYSQGHVALVGDAGYCASPISGMGTSLALVGAYVLAGALASHRDHTAAFDIYETVMRPYAEQAQQLPPGAPRLANPKTRAGIAIFNTGLRIASSKRLSRIGDSLFSPPADAIELPDYSRLLEFPRP